MNLTGIREQQNLSFSPDNTTSLEASSMGKHFDESGTNPELPYFELSIIVSATGNFSLDNKLGEGGFGAVYKVWSLWQEGRAVEIVGSWMTESDSDKEVLRCIHIALLCVQESANDRPNMSDVAFMLCNETALPPSKQPAFIFKGDSSKPGTSSSASAIAVSINDVTLSTIQAR
ncbi:hypothetical protein RHGRI_037385 [Rhododendron griersonianum]|uniref:S-locus receptor kinase C-terminal domain-containing protein n=1 Tax=Rhododendron griersonianum TaxID=479676 RepID=A0AAV6HVS6_9ERIC|nr:hypothetical protein RHGRI_037385 [Rhododendron griersonianum]